MVCCISFNILNKKIIIPLFGGICYFVLKYLVCELSPSNEESNKDDKDNNYKLIEHPIILSICSSLGMSLSLFPYLITIKRIKTEKQKNMEKHFSTLSKSVNSKSLIINYDYDEEYEGITYDKFKYIFLASFLDFLQTLLGFFVYYSIDLNLWVLDIILISILSIYIFGTKLYKHQKLCLILIFI